MSESQKSLPDSGDVFISYRRCNAKLVKPIEEELIRRGISYFIDRIGVDYGMDYSKIIARAIKKCKILLVIWTKEADDSEDMLREVKMAFELKKTVIPYKVGSFDVTEHDALYYQLSTINRQEADPQQTPETIKELVNRIEVQLKWNVTKPTTEPIKKPQSPRPPKNDDFSIPGTRAGERKTIIVKDVEFAFRWCPPGTFMMGESSKHKVNLAKGFWIMETQVTQIQWKAVMGKNPSYFKGNDNPVDNVSWEDCNKFCKKCARLGLPVQLPTEVQWEYACRAGKGSNAGQLDNIAWYAHNSKNKTHPVGQKKPNAWGLYDMHGNVCEWCQDKHEYIDERVIRGGCYCSTESWCTSGTRWSYNAAKQTDDTGFRCVVIPKDNSEN